MWYEINVTNESPSNMAQDKLNEILFLAHKSALKFEIRELYEPFLQMLSSISPVKSYKRFCNRRSSSKEKKNFECESVITQHFLSYGYNRISYSFP